MKKVLFTILFVAISVSFTQAQVEKGKFAIGIGGEVALPSGDVADIWDLGTGFGGTVRVEYGFSKNLVGVADVGYLMFPGEEKEYVTGLFTTEKASIDLSAVVALFGVKYYFSKGFYGLGQAGYHNFDVEAPGITVTIDSRFGLAAGAGYELPLGSLLLDLSAKYVLATSDFNYLGIRAGVKFPL
jgi:hypothetical protein